MSIARKLTPLLCVWSIAGCKVYDPRYCDADRPCSDPLRSFCDVNGDYPASEGIGRTCIPDPFVDGGSDDGEEPDADDGDQTGDDGDSIDGGADRFVIDLAVGPDRTCAILNDGGLRCWGSGPLGYPPEVGVVGDNEHPYEVGDVPAGGPVKQVALGDDFSCLLYEAGNVRCFGAGMNGQLGYGNTVDIDAIPADIDDVSLGEPARQIVAAETHACALLESGAIRCWGLVRAGFVNSPLGYGNLETVGDNEVPSDLPAIEIGGAVIALSTAFSHMCAILGGADGRVRCWGHAGILDPYSVLGHPGIRILGDDEAPSSAGDVSIGGKAIAIQSSRSSNCVLLEGGAVRCWGSGLAMLGYGNATTYGDNESPAAAPELSLGGIARALNGGIKCALMSNGDVRCWGHNGAGELGLGNTDHLGDNELPVAAEAISLGGPAIKLSSGIPGLPPDAIDGSHACALLENHDVRCWGVNTSGQLGLGHQENIGDNEVPSDEPPVRVLE